MVRKTCYSSIETDDRHNPRSIQPDATHEQYAKTRAFHGSRPGPRAVSDGSNIIRGSSRVPTGIPGSDPTCERPWQKRANKHLVTTLRPTNHKPRLTQRDRAHDTLLARTDQKSTFLTIFLVGWVRLHWPWVMRFVGFNTITACFLYTTKLGIPHTP